MLVRNLLKRNPQRKVENKKNFTFIGLWNPQKKYEKTRHNIGADCLFRLSKRNNINLKTHKSGKFQLGSYEEDGYEIDIVIPMVSMNNSGEAVKEYIKNKNMDYENLVVLHDDIDLGFGRLRLKKGSGDGGHNGIKSINYIINATDYFRLRIGVGRPPSGIDPAEYVLSRFLSDEIEEIKFLVEDAIDIVNTVDGLWAAQDWEGMRPYFADSLVFTRSNGSVTNTFDDFIATQSGGAQATWEYNYAYSVDLNPSVGGEYVNAGFEVTYPATDDSDEVVNWNHENYFVQDGKIISLTQYTVENVDKD